jgi:AcrR family transcriptional regulator
MTRVAGAPPSPSGDAREQRRIQRLEIGRVQVLDAAEALFAENGYTATSLESIATRSGFSVGGLYVFFENKEAMYLAVMQRRGSIIQQRMHACLDLDATGLAKLLNMVSAAVGTIQEYPAYGRLVLNAVGETFAAVRDRRPENRLFAEGVDLYAAAIEQGQADGLIRAGEPVNLAIIVAGIVTMYAQIDTVIADNPKGMKMDELLEIIRNAVSP